MGEGGELESWEYQGGTFTATGSWLAVGGKKLVELEQERTIINANQILNTGDAITLQQAKEAVPVDKRTRGMLLIYKEKEKLYRVKIYVGNKNQQTDFWTSDEYWKDVLTTDDYDKRFNLASSIYTNLEEEVVLTKYDLTEVGTVNSSGGTSTGGAYDNWVNSPKLFFISSDVLEVYISTGGSSGICFLNSDLTAVKFYKYNDYEYQSVQQFPRPEGCNLFRICCNKEDLDNWYAKFTGIPTFAKQSYVNEIRGELEQAKNDIASLEQSVDWVINPVKNISDLGITDGEYYSGTNGNINSSNVWERTTNKIIIPKNTKIKILRNNAPYSVNIVNTWNLDGTYNADKTLRDVSEFEFDTDLYVALSQGGNFKTLGSAVLMTDSSYKEDSIAKLFINSIIASGASFSDSSNGWLELMAKSLGVTLLNYSEGGSNITKLTSGLYSNGDTWRTLYDVLFITHVHDYDVYQLPEQLENYKPSDYENDDVLGSFIKTKNNTIPDSLGDYTKQQLYAIGFDYCIKKWKELKYTIHNNNDYPAEIVLCTAWHDWRPTFNNSVKQLSDKWGLSLVDLASNIGFSKEKTHPYAKGYWDNSDGSWKWVDDSASSTRENVQVSVLFGDTTGYGPTQVIDGITYGFHPMRGQDSYIQKKMASIGKSVFEKLFGL